MFTCTIFLKKISGLVLQPKIEMYMKTGLIKLQGQFFYIKQIFNELFCLKIAEGRDNTGYVLP